MRRHILIMLYEEGVSNLTDVQTLGSDYALERMLADVNSAIRAVVSLDYRAYVCDVFERVGEQLKPEISKNVFRVRVNDLAKLCQDRFRLDGVVLVGAHAKNNAPQSFASYSVNKETINRYFINGVECGDIGLAMAYFGAYNIPVVAITGDLAAIAEAQGLVENLPGAVVKTADVRERTNSALSPSKADSLIFETVLFGVSICEDIMPYKTGAPYSIKIVYNTPADCDDAIKRNSQKGLKRIDARTLEKRLDMIIDFNDLRL